MAQVSHLAFRAGCAHCVKRVARDWPHHYDSGLTPAIHKLARDFCVTDIESDDALTILVMKETILTSRCDSDVRHVSN